MPQRDLGRVDRIVAGALEKQPSSSLRTFLRLRLHELNTLEERVSVTHLIGETRGSDMLAFLLEVVGEISRQDRASPVVSGSIRLALAQVLDRSPESSLNELQKLWSRCDPSFKETVIRCVAERGDAESLVFLCDRYGEDSHNDELLLAEIVRLARNADAEGTGHALQAVREALDGDVALRRLGAQAVATLRDFDSFERLVPLLEDQDHGVRRVALDSLRQLSGRRYGAEASPWWEYTEKEKQWFLEEGSGVLERLGSDRPEQLIETLRTVVCHRLFCDKFQEVLAGLLCHSSVQVCVAAAHTLGELGSREALEPLRDALDNEDESVQAAVRQALDVIGS